MIKWFIITIVGLYVNVLERPSAVYGLRLNLMPPPAQNHTHTHTHPTTHPTLWSLTLQSKTQGIGGIGANREMSLPLLLLPLGIADTDQHTKPLLTGRWEKGFCPPHPEQPGSSGVWSQGSPAGMTAIQWSRTRAPCRDHALTDRHG